MAELPSENTVKEYGQEWWMLRIKEAEKELKEGWWTYGDAIVNRYLDKRGDSATEIEKRKYNMFWANVQIMKSALYATPPKPMVTRQNGDSKDDVARTAALMLQRMLDIGINKDASDMHAAFKYGVDDRLIPGMGQVWLRYDVETKQESVPADELGPGYDSETILSEQAPCDYVHWRDFLWSPARIWEEVWWVGRRIWMKRKKFKRRFGEEKYKQIQGNYENSNRDLSEEQGVPKGFSKGRVEVLEVWCEDSNKVYFINRHADELLEVKDDPLGLDDFFPCPKPLLATHTTNSLVPRADYTMVQDQYGELDVLNDRISILTQALRVVGVYDKAQAELSRLLSGSEFQMIAVDNWAMLAEKNGLKGTVDWFPVETIAEVLERLMNQRVALVGQIYELTSISDIMRGASSPQETAKAQTLKAQYSSVRLQLTQQDVARWVGHAMMLKAEIICRHFQPQTILEQSQIQFTESAQYALPAVELLKQFNKAEYRIEISEQSLSLADYNAERELRVEYITAVGQFFSQAAKLLEGRPEALPYLMRMVQWVTAAFRGSSDIESVLDEAIQAASQPQPQQPDPAIAIEQAKAQADAQKTQATEQTKQLAEQNKLAIADMQIKSAERIAAASDDTKKVITDANNETKLLIEKIKAGLTEMIESANLAHEESKRQTEEAMERMRLGQEAMSSHLDRQAAERTEARQVDADARSQLTELVNRLADVVKSDQQSREKAASAPRKVHRDASGKAVATEINGIIREIKRSVTGQIEEI